MKGILGEFKKFILRGNIIDMAVGVIIGSAFSAIVTSLTNKIFMPLINLIIYAATGGNGINLITVLNGEPYLVDVDGVATVNSKCIYIDWGNFIQAIINFLLIAIVLFVIVKVANTIAAKRKAMIDDIKAKKEAKNAPAEEEAPVEEPAPAPAPEAPTATNADIVAILAEIRDQLKATATKEAVEAKEE